MSTLDELRGVLMENRVLTLGTMVRYQTGSDQDVGVVIGMDGGDALVVSAFSVDQKADATRRKFRDTSLTDRARGMKSAKIKGALVDVTRVPVRLLDVIGKLTGTDARGYWALAAELNLPATGEPHE